MVYGSVVSKDLNIFLFLNYFKSLIFSDNKSSSNVDFKLSASFAKLEHYEIHYLLFFKFYFFLVNISFFEGLKCRNLSFI